MKSEIKKIIKDKKVNGAYFGFIKALDDGKDYYFKSQI